MAKSSFKDLLESTYDLKEAKEEEVPEEMEDEEIEDDEEDEDVKDERDLDELPKGKADYSPDDFREIIDYVYEILDREDDDELNESVDEIGLDLLYEIADALPQTVINELVANLQEIFEIEDTMLQECITEGFVKKKKGTIAKAASKLAKKAYKKNKSKVKLKAKKWRKSARGKLVAKLHKKLQARLGSKKGARLVNTALPDAPETK